MTAHEQREVGVSVKKAILYYFSGCGNTNFIANQTSQTLVEQGYEVELFDIEQNPEYKKSDLCGFLFPIYGFGIPQLVVKFLKKLPNTQGQKSFIFLTPAGHEGIGIVQTLALLNSKKFDVITAQTMFMPDTWTLVQNAPTDEEYNEYSSNANDDIKKHISEIIENKKNIKIAHFFWLVLLGGIYLLFYFIGRHQAGKCFCANSNCTECKICVETCPSKTIQWKKNKPYWSWNCQQCYRCLNTCPTNAIEVSGVGIMTTTLALFLGAKAYDLMPFFITNKLDDFYPIPQFLCWAGVMISIFWLTQLYLAQDKSIKWCITKNKIRYKR